MTFSSSSLRIGHLQKKVSSKTVRRCLQQAQEDLQIRELVFIEIDFQRLTHDMRVLCQQRQFASLKFVACTHLEAILTVVCDYNATVSLVVSGPVPAAAGHALNEGLRTNRSLRTLKLLGVNLVDFVSANDDDDDDDDMLLSGLTRNCTLQHLDLSRSHFCQSTSLGRSLQASSSIRSLNLSDCRLQDETLADLLTKLPSSLRCLNLSQNAVHAKTLRALAGLLSVSSSANPSLQSLNLSECVAPVPVTEDDDDSNHQHALAAALGQTLHALGTNTALRDLDVSGNALWQDTAVVGSLTASLAQNTTLQSVNVSDSGITADGMAVLAKHLPEFSTQLRVLNVLSGNHQDAAVDDLLLQGLQNNTTLTDLGDDASIMVSHYLNLNQAGRRALTASGMPLGIWSTLLARAADNHNGIFGLLQGPALLER